MHKRLLILAMSLIVVLSLSSTGCQKKATSTSSGAGPMSEKKESGKRESPFIIGVVASLTGDYSDLGIPEKNTLIMEADKINKAGGINGYPIKLVIEDDATDSAKAVSAVSKLISADKAIAVIGSSGTGATMAMRTEIQKAQIPQISMASGTSVYEPVDKWVFGVAWPNRIMAEKVIGYLKAQNIDQVAILADNGGFGKDGLAVLEKKIPEAGIGIAASETYAPTDLDMKAQLTKIKGSTAKAILVWGAGKGPAIIANEIKELNITIPAIFSHGIARREFLEGAGVSADGIIFPSGKIIVPESYGDSKSAEVTKKFILDYTSKYGEAPNGTFPGHAFDALNILVDALERLGQAPDAVDTTKLRDAIEKTSKLDLIGGTFSYSPTDHAGTTVDDVIFVKVEGGKFIWLKP